MSLPFQVKQQYPQKSEELIADFKYENDAQAYFEEMISRAHKMRQKLIYAWYGDNGTKLINRVDAEKHESIDSSGNQTSVKSARPKPLSTSPRPPGTLPNLKQEDDLDDD